MNIIKKLLEKWLEKHHYYQIEDLRIGGNCGLCGALIPNEIFPAYWAWGICKKCWAEYGEE